MASSGLRDKRPRGGRGGGINGGTTYGGGWRYFFAGDNSTATQTETRIEGSSVNTLRSNLETLLKDNKCKQFVEAVISNLASSVGPFKKFEGTILENFDRIRNSKGYWLKDTKYLGEYHDEKIWFQRNSFRPTDDQVDRIALGKEFNEGKDILRFDISRRSQITFTLIHELIHAYYPSLRSGSTRASHDAMAIAAQNALVSTGLVAKAIPITGTSGKDFYSTYFDNALIRACGGVIK